MKKISNAVPGFTKYLVLLYLLAMQSTSCKKEEAPLSATQTSSIAADDNVATLMPVFKQYNLVADNASFGAPRLDPKLQNAWGLSANDEGQIWVSANEKGLGFVYGLTGKHLMAPVSIPSHDPAVHSNPTGNIYNNTNDFIIPGTGTKAEFIFADEGGTISAWNDATGTTAVVVADRTAWDPVYKGLAISQDNGDNFMYVTNFKQHKIDVFDSHFNYVSNKPFTDPSMPNGYAPFNIRNFNGMLYVTYALQKAGGEDDSSGMGHGFVDIYHPDGQLEMRFASRGTLNSPWGIAEARPGAAGDKNAMLIGNFGDGHINVFSTDGHFKGELMTDSGPVAIDGLWAIDNEIPGIKPTQLYFTAGPNDESDGIFGFLMRQ